MDTMTVNHREYEIIKLLGKGKGGYSYLATDGVRKFVLKKIHHEPCNYYQFGNKLQAEIEDYKRLKKIGIRMPELLGIDKEQEIICKEYIEGDTIYDLILQDKMENQYLEQVQAMCSLLYPANTNIDYFPTNFVASQRIIYYIDYECNDYMKEWDFENWGIAYWSKTKTFLTNVNKEVVRRFFQAGYADHDYEKVMELVDEHYIDHSPAGARSNKEAVSILKLSSELFAEMKIEILDLFGEEDRVATRVKYSGRHQGEYIGAAATGKEINFEALENFKVEDGKIVESWGYWPDLEILGKIKGNI